MFTPKGLCEKMCIIIHKKKGKFLHQRAYTLRCWFQYYVEYLKNKLTLVNARAGNFSQANSRSSPNFSSRWPLKILAAVNVVTPIPSPTRNITFFARSRLVPYKATFSSIAVLAFWYQYSWPVKIKTFGYNYTHVFRKWDTKGSFRIFTF